MLQISKDSPSVMQFLISEEKVCSTSPPFPGTDLRPSQLVFASAKNTSPILPRSGRSCSSSSSTHSDWSAAAFYATSTTTSYHFFRRAHPVVCMVDVPVLNFARYLTVDSFRARTARIFALTDSGLRCDRNSSRRSLRRDGVLIDKAYL